MRIVTGEWTCGEDCNCDHYWCDIDDCWMLAESAKEVQIDRLSRTLGFIVGSAMKQTGRNSPEEMTVAEWIRRHRKDVSA